MVDIRLRNSLTHRVEPLVPLDPHNVRLYLCGPTVYERAHLGNARNVIMFDILFRLLRHVYGVRHVTYVRNFTDVDDKINARAAQDNRPIRQITDETIAWFLQDMGALGVLEPTHMPRATSHIADMIALIEDLIARKHAYVANGHVLFAVDSDSAYGRLSGRSLADMKAGARVEAAPYKRNPLDFVLWKPSQHPAPAWDSPWGQGRPGWHIECSAMSKAFLGTAFDIHGGGMDLLFPHHENEMAQSRCAHPGAGFAQIWLHNEMLRVDGQKMSKSLGNFVSVRDLLDQGHSGAAIRLVFMSTHYRKTLDWTASKLGKAETHLHDLIATIAARGDLDAARTRAPTPDIVMALADDLNTHAAVRVLSGKGLDGTQLAADLVFLGVLSWDQMIARVGAFHQMGETLETLASRLEALYGEATKTRDFTRVDGLRTRLEAAGVSVRVSRSKVALIPGAGCTRAALESLS